jgi:hypothetical protein
MINISEISKKKLLIWLKKSNTKMLSFEKLNSSGCLNQVTDNKNKATKKTEAKCPKCKLLSLGRRFGLVSKFSIFLF